MKCLVHNRHGVNSDTEGRAWALSSAWVFWMPHYIWCYLCLTPYGTPPNGVLPTPVFLGFPCGLAGKESACNAQDLGLIPGLGRSPGEGKGYRLQYSGLENSMDCIVHGVAKSRTRLSNFHFSLSLHMGTWSLWSVRVVALGLPALLNKVGQSGMRDSPCPPLSPGGWWQRWTLQKY